MNKVKIIIVIVVMIVLVSFVIFMNYDKINNYINDKQWQIVDSIAQIYTNKYLQIGSCGDKIIIIENDRVCAYTSTASPEYIVDCNMKDVVIDSNRDYCAIGENGGSRLILLNDKGKLWDFDVSGEIMAVSVNKNGYVACIYSKSGYKSLVKVIDASGSELFTNHLASTYALDAEISTDNKILAIAEVNTEGINMESDIKIVNINGTESRDFKTVKLDSNTLVLDIEYTDKNELVVLEDNRIEKLSTEYERAVIKEFGHNDVIRINIENGNNVIFVEKNDTGIFSTEYVLKVYENNESKEYVLDSSTEMLCAQGKTICTNIGNQVLFLNTSGKLIKRCRVEGQIKDIKLYANGSMAAIVFRDKIDIIKL